MDTHNGIENHEIASCSSRTTSVSVEQSRTEQNRVKQSKTEQVFSVWFVLVATHIQSLCLFYFDLMVFYGEF